MSKFAYILGIVGIVFMGFVASLPTAQATPAQEAYIASVQQ